MLCLVTVAGCLVSCTAPNQPATSEPPGAADPAALTEASDSGRNTRPGEPAAISYPYSFWIGQAVYEVRQEPAGTRLQIEFVRWSEFQGATEAVFRVTNPGPVPVLVWNVRRQVSDPTATNAVAGWETRECGYPDRWDHDVISAGGSAQFPMVSTTDLAWRPCILYSREVGGSGPEHRQFAGDFEAVGPSVRDNQVPGR